MASYSMELWEMAENPLTPLFAFNYDFYCDDLEVKKKFEEKFINHYWLHEIGCETPALPGIHCIQSRSIGPRCMEFTAINQNPLHHTAWNPLHSIEIHWATLHGIHCIQSGFI